MENYRNHSGRASISELGICRTNGGGVLAYHRFENFADLYANLPLLKYGYTSETISNTAPDDMNQYYCIEEQIRHGVIGIEIELI